MTPPSPLERLLGRAEALQGRVVALTGASGSFGSGMRALLEARGAVVRPLKHGRDWTYEDYTAADEALAEADLLVLAHGSKEDHAMEANADSFVVFVERFRRMHPGERVEVWAVGSEIELHPAFGAVAYHDSKRAFARVARSYLHDPSLVYRHIVPASFTSPMGPGLISGRTAAAWALILILRGWRYVPVTYVGFALLNWFKFLFRWHAISAGEYLASRGLTDRVTAIPG